MSDDTTIKTFAFDFDGVISEYHGFQGVEHVGQPISQIVEAIRKLKELGHTIIVYSSRDSKLIQEYCALHTIPVDHINCNPKYPDSSGRKPIAHAYVDDRAVRFSLQSSDSLVAELLEFKPYWK